LRVISISASDSYTNGSGIESDCTLTIAPPHGIISKGKLWGSFECPNFREPTDVAGTGCYLSGTMLFENCAD